MRNKYLLALFLILPIFFFAGWIVKIENDLNSEKTVLVRMRGYDPVDLISGHYLYLRPDWNLTDCSQFDKGVCPTELFGYNYRYYVPEFDAQILDQKLWSENPRVDLLFAYRGKSKPLVKALYIDGVSWDKWLEQSQKSHVQKDKPAN